MTSLQSAYSQIPSNKLYVNITDARSTITDINLSTLFGPPGAFATALTTAGGCIIRDMGKTVYLPSPTVSPVNGAGGISTVLRKVQLVTSGTAGAYGTGAPAGVANVGGVPDYYTGYIQIGALTYGGGNGVGTLGPVKFVRLN